MHFILTCFFLPMINAILTVQIHRDSFYQPNSPCAFIRNTTLPNDTSIQSCIWECDYEYDCQTAVYFHEKKICSTFIELCETSSIQHSVRVQSSVICYRKNHKPISTCLPTSTAVIDVTTSATQTTITSAMTTTPETALNMNLVRNGDAETGPCESGDNVTPPTEWNNTGPITQIFYNNTARTGMNYSTPGPSDRGLCLFYGQYLRNTSMRQTISLISPVDHLLIDNQTVMFNFSAWIGGYQTDLDNAAVSLYFFDQSNQILNNRTIGPVLPIDRGGITSLLFRHANGLVPVGTRFLTVLVEITFYSGSWNNGYVDNIIVILHQ